MGVVVTVLAVGVGQSFTSVPMLFATPTYYAQFTDTGGISTGDKVRIAGVEVGLVRSLAIRGNRVLIGFSLPGRTIGRTKPGRDSHRHHPRPQEHGDRAARLHNHCSPTVFCPRRRPRRRTRSTMRSSTPRRRRRAGTSRPPNGR